VSQPRRSCVLRLEKCVLCVLAGPCRKECQGVSVDSIAAAQKMRGCTYIKGSLEIQIRGGSEYRTPAR
jgi:insulin receptor